MADFDKLISSIVRTASDYRGGKVLTPQRVWKWIEQFEEKSRLAVLAEVDYVLKETYWSRARVERVLRQWAGEHLRINHKLRKFWSHANFLNIQRMGNSQKEILKLFEPILEQTCGASVHQSVPDSNRFVYMDDGVFSGHRVKSDLERWIRTDAPDTATVWIYTLVRFSGGHWYARSHLEEVIAQCGKRIKLRWRSVTEYENRRAYINISDVLAPKSIPASPEVQQYIRSMRRPPTLRNLNGIGRAKLFCSSIGRHVLEQEFLKQGARIRQMCPLLPINARPLGSSALETLGFGSLVVTYRNCPNNAPLAFWADKPWIPLFPRKTNTRPDRLRSANRMVTPWRI